MDEYQRLLLAICIWLAVRATVEDTVMMYVIMLFWLLIFVLYQPPKKDGE